MSTGRVTDQRSGTKKEPRRRPVVGCTYVKCSGLSIYYDGAHVPSAIFTGEEGGRALRILEG